MLYLENFNYFFIDNLKPNRFFSTIERGLEPTFLLM